MTRTLALGALVCCVFGGTSTALPAAPVPREKPLLRCEATWVGKSTVKIGGDLYEADTPDVASVTITNISNADVDIGGNCGPYQYLDVRVKDPAGVDLKTKPLSSLLSAQTLFEKPYILKPGEKYLARVALLNMVPEEKRVAGTYKGKVVYIFKGTEYSSDWIGVECPFKDGPWIKK